MNEDEGKGIFGLVFIVFTVFCLFVYKFGVNV